MFQKDTLLESYLLAQRIVWDLFTEGILTYEGMLENLERIDRQYHA